MSIEDVLAKIRATASAVTIPERLPPNVRHSAENPDWQTPQEDIDCARTALGGVIGLDPFSCISGNARVGALEWLGPDHPDPSRRDGFSAKWIADTIYENHPGGTTALAWEKTCAEYASRHFRALIWMGFSVEQVCILSDPGERDEPREVRWARGAFVPTDFSLCFLRKRVHFIDAGRPERPSRPGHANFVIGVGVDPTLFELAYARRGQCIHGPLALPR